MKQRLRRIAVPLPMRIAAVACAGHAVWEERVSGVCLAGPLFVCPRTAVTGGYIADTVRPGSECSVLRLSHCGRPVLLLHDFDYDIHSYAEIASFNLYADKRPLQPTGCRHRNTTLSLCACGLLKQKVHKSSNPQREMPRMRVYQIERARRAAELRQ